MYAELPDSVKRVVTEYLLADDFRTAKQIHDNWMASRQCANQGPMDIYPATAESY